MKIAFLVKYYESYQNNMLLKNPNWNDLNYDSLIEKINDDYFLMYNSFVKYLSRLGHEVQLIIPNMKLLQNKWIENRKIVINGNWELEIAQLQISEFKPDILFLNSNFEYWGGFLEKAKKHSKKVCGWLSCPFPKSLSFKHIDLVYTLFPPHHTYFKSIGINSKLVHAGFDQEIYSMLKPDPTIDVSFIGGIGAYHKKRTEFLMKLASSVKIDFWGYGFESSNLIKTFLKHVITKFRFYNNYNGLAWGTDMYSAIGNSKISINVHGDIAKEYSVNMRMFEATGMGSLLLTEKTDYLNNFFDPEKEVITYNNVDEAKEKIKYYLENDSERIKIAKAGQERTFKDYNYKTLIKNYEADFIELLNK